MWPCMRNRKNQVTDNQPGLCSGQSSSISRDSSEGIARPLGEPGREGQKVEGVTLTIQVKAERAGWGSEPFSWWTGVREAIKNAVNLTYSALKLWNHLARQLGTTSVYTYKASDNRRRRPNTSQFSSSVQNNLLCMDGKSQAQSTVEHAHS